MVALAYDPRPRLLPSTRTTPTTGPAAPSSIPAAPPTATPAAAPVDAFVRTSPSPSSSTSRAFSAPPLPTPSSTASSAPLSAPEAAPTPFFNGTTPASGTTNTNAARPVTPVVSGSPSARDAATYDNVINQFAVANNPRYTPRDSSGDGLTDTFCNIFVSDVTSAMGAPIPHQVDANGRPVPAGQGRELDANATVDWLHDHGAQYGWRPVSEAEAQRLANEGHPTVAVQKNPGDIGHVGVVRPGTMNANGPALAQAGARNFNQGHVYDSFTRGRTEFWVNDTGTTSTPATTPTSTTPATPATPSTTTPTGTTPAVTAPGVDLGIGAQGPAVEQLQRALVSLRHLGHADMNTGPGTFGPRTQAAVTSFQRANGLPATGFYGPLTRAALGRALAAVMTPAPTTPAPTTPAPTTPAPTTPAPTTPAATTPATTPVSWSTATAPAQDLQRGAQGPAVEQLQRALVSLGYLTQAAMDTGPGIYGSQTEGAVKAFQATHGVSGGGRYGPQTRAALQAALASPTTSSVKGLADPTLGQPSGAFRSVNGGTWEDVNRFDPIVSSAAREFGVPADLLKAMMVVESRGNPNAWRGADGVDDHPAVGLMQVKPFYWGNLVPGADAYTPEGNVRIAAALLRDGYRRTGSWEGAITQVYFPVDDVNGTSQRDYLDMVAGLRAEMRAAR